MKQSLKLSQKKSLEDILKLFLEESQNKFIKNMWNSRITVFEGFIKASTTSNKDSLENELEKKYYFIYNREFRVLSLEINFSDLCLNLVTNRHKESTCPAIEMETELTRKMVKLPGYYCH